MMKVHFLCMFLALQIYDIECLYPRESITREVLNLDGLWNFYLNKDAKANGSLSGTSNDKDVFLMPVPSSYNDILTSIEGRDYVGSATYEQIFYLPLDWLEDISLNRILLKFGSVSYSASVYVNEALVATHQVGKLPFEADITSVINQRSTEPNTFRIVVSNTLSSSTIPQGKQSTDPGGKTIQSFSFDYFNYAGVDRSVILYRTPNAYVEDVTLTTTISDTTGVIDFQILLGGSSGAMDTVVTVFDRDGKSLNVTKLDNITTSGQIKIENAQFWWPYLMNDDPGYLYTFRVELFFEDDIVDRYDLPFGIRELSWSDSTFLINGEPIYLRGFSHHEDSDFRGQGLDLPIILRDYNLLRWIGANAFRTCNYPFAEEIMELADQLGILIINEIPAVGLSDYSAKGLLETHLQAINELYTRDKNRPSVIMWALASEPTNGQDAAAKYFKNITDHTRALDPTRPITLPSTDATNNYTQQYADILSFNIYEGWDSYVGELDVILTEITKTAENWNKRYGKPVLITEYGSNTQEGYHSLPGFVWSEEYQEDLMSKHFEAFDELRSKGWFIGELIDSFADFRSPQTIYSVGGVKKGVFTRSRQPKSGAFTLRKRFWDLAQELDNATVPENLDKYATKRYRSYRDEL